MRPSISAKGAMDRLTGLSSGGAYPHSRLARRISRPSQGSAAQQAGAGRFSLLGRLLGRLLVGRELLQDAAGIVIVTFALLVYGVLQERIVTIGFGSQKEVFEHSIFLVFCNRLVTCAIALAYLLAARQPTPPAAPLRAYAAVSLTNVIATSCQYEALKYVSFAVQTLVKSGKALPVMLWGTVYMQKRYRMTEFFHAVTITLGCSVFILSGDVVSRVAQHALSSSSLASLASAASSTSSLSAASLAGPSKPAAALARSLLASSALSSTLSSAPASTLSSTLSSTASSASASPSSAADLGRALLSGVSLLGVGVSGAASTAAGGGGGGGGGTSGGGDSTGGGGGGGGSTALLLVGGGLMLCYLVVDGLTSTWQDSMFHGYPVSVCDQVLYTTAFSMAMSLAGCLATQQLLPALAFLRRNPEAGVWILALSAASAVVQLVISWTIKRYGAVVFATIMTTRQFFSILLSSMVFVTPLSAGQWAGTLLVFGALYYKAVQKCNEHSTASVKNERGEAAPQPEGRAQAGRGEPLDRRASRSDVGSPFEPSSPYAHVHDFKAPLLEARHSDAADQA